MCIRDRKLWTDLSEIFWECREWQKLSVIRFWGWSGRNPGFWITLKFSLTLLSTGHTGNCYQTEYGAATWRTTWRWRRCAVSDCFLVYKMWTHYSFSIYRVSTFHANYVGILGLWCKTEYQCSAHDLSLFFSSFTYHCFHDFSLYIFFQSVCGFPVSIFIADCLPLIMPRHRCFYKLCCLVSQQKTAQISQ